MDSKLSRDGRRSAFTLSQRFLVSAVERAAPATTVGGLVVRSDTAVRGPRRGQPGGGRQLHQPRAAAEYRARQGTEHVRVSDNKCYELGTLQQSIERAMVLNMCA